MDAVVSFVLHRYSAPAGPPVSVLLSPSQIVAFEAVIAAAGRVFTFTTIDVVAIQELASVTVRSYVVVDDGLTVID